ncbi:MAG: phosphatidate cytidylyltransferase [Bacteroidota bacterium]|nr:phosphatidate cytidylyltransferase [Bacteroidota bacterium]
MLLSCVWFSPWTFGLFFAGVQAVMLREFYRIMRAGGYAPAAWIGIGAGSLLFLAIFIMCFGNAMYVNGVKGAFAASDLAPIFESIQPVIIPLAAATLFLLPTVLIVREMRQWPQQKQPFTNISLTILGFIYITFPMSMLNTLAFIHNKGFFPQRVVALLFLIWASDIGAYIAGKSFGKRKMAPSISPGKTWEGWAGGFLLTLVIGWAMGYFLPDVPLTHRLAAAGVVAVFAPLGDLAESMLKRSVGVKDSGTFLPGHGGLLDRFDAFLLVLPVLALLQLLAG